MTIPGSLISTLFAKTATASAVVTTSVNTNNGNVSLLISGNGTNGSTYITDTSLTPNTITGVTGAWAQPNTITAYGNAKISTAQSKWGGSSISFGPGNGSYLKLSKAITFSSTTNFTIEGWIYPTATSTSGLGYSVLFGQSGVNYPQFMQYWPDGSVSYYNGGAGYRSVSSKLSFNQWSHYAIVRQGSSVKIYINGVDVGISISDNQSVTIDTIGGYGASPADYNVIGYMSDIRFTTGVARYTSDFSVPTAQFEDISSWGSLTYTIDNPNAYGAGTNDYFGYSVAVDGDYAIVGAYGENDASGTTSGKAYIYNVTTGALLWTLTNPNQYGTSSGDVFGVVVAISGNYAIVGSQEDDAGGIDSGKAYIYDVTTGNLVRTLNNPNPYGTATSDVFGQAVGISGNYAIVSAYRENDAGGTTSGKAYIYNVTTGALLHTLSNPNAYGTSAGDLFGTAVGISGNYAIVSTYSEDDASGTNSGAAYIFNVTTGALLWTLTNPNAYGTSLNDQFGWSVAISGNYAIVGANLEDSTYYDVSTGGINAGRAYIFDVTTGKLLNTLNNPNAGVTYTNDQYGASTTIASNEFGYAVAISGNYALVSSVQQGKVYYYEVTTGTLIKTLSRPPGTGDYLNYNFGYSVAISGNHIVVGDRAAVSAAGINSGRMFIYQVAEKVTMPTTVSTASLAYTLNNPNAYYMANGDQFGYAVAVSGKYAIVGAYKEDDGGTDSGKAYIYNVATGALVKTLDNPNPEANAQFGTSVSISGNYAIVGAPLAEGATSPDSGKAYIFNATTGVMMNTLTNPNAYSTPANDQFGISVTISGNYAIVGAWGEDDADGTESGKIYTYNVTTGALLSTISNPNASKSFSGSGNDWFGSSVALSGNYIIAGARGEDDFALSGNGNDSGNAYIFDVATGTLLQTLNNPNPYGTSANDNFGYKVAISGNYAVVGAYLEDAPFGVTQSGKAYVFDVITGALLQTLNNANNGTNNYFGYSVAVSGNYATVAAPGTGDASGFAGSGKVHIFDVTTGALVKTIDNPNTYGGSFNDGFGTSVAIYGNYVVVGANGEDEAGITDSGKAYIYTLS